jgi:hypothetical protein
MGSPAREKLIDELSAEELMRRNREAIALVEGWMKEDPAYDLETLPLLKKALDASRDEVGARRLFPDEDPSGR